MSVSIQVDDKIEEHTPLIPTESLIPSETPIKKYISYCVGTLLCSIMIIGLADLAIGWLFMQMWGFDGFLAWVIPVGISFIAMCMCFGLFATGACCCGHENIL
jgi:hypothetical protein